MPAVGRYSSMGMKSLLKLLNQKDRSIALKQENQKKWPGKAAIGRLKDDELQYNFGWIIAIR